MEDVLNGLTDGQVAHAALQRQGRTKDEATAILLADPSIIGRLAADERAAMNEKAEKIREQAHAASPAGRVKAAAEARNAADERAELVANARILLEQEGSISPGEEMSEADILHLSGIEEQFDRLPQGEQWRRQEIFVAGADGWENLDLVKQSEAARAVGLTAKEVTRTRAILRGEDVGDIQ